jgi:hypothetical protein
MKYEKPQIAVVGSAVDAVQSSMIKEQPPVDSRHETTVAAYKADEE